MFNIHSRPRGVNCFLIGGYKCIYVCKDFKKNNLIQRSEMFMVLSTQYEITESKKSNIKKEDIAGHGA